MPRKVRQVGKPKKPNVERNATALPAKRGRKKIEGTLIEASDAISPEGVAPPAPPEITSPMSLDQFREHLRSTGTLPPDDLVQPAPEAPQKVCEVCGDVQCLDAPDCRKEAPVTILKTNDDDTLVIPTVPVDTHLPDFAVPTDVVRLEQYNEINFPASSSSVMIRYLPHYGKLPPIRRQTEGASGFDLYAAITETIPVVKPGMVYMIPTGISIAMSPGVEAQIRSRSGLATKHGIVVVNSPGTIDADYRGEIMVALVNLTGARVFIEPGMRIAQMVFCPVVLPSLIEVDELPASTRGTGGFGSTGF